MEPREEYSALSIMQTGSLLASKPQIKLQVHGEGSVSTGLWCLKRYDFSNHHQLLWNSYLSCLVFYISLPSGTGTLNLRSWHTLTMKRPIDQTVNIQSMKKWNFRRKLLTGSYKYLKTEEHSKSVLLCFPFYHLTCLFIKL